MLYAATSGSGSRRRSTIALGRLFRNMFIGIENQHPNHFGPGRPPPAFASQTPDQRLEKTRQPRDRAIARVSSALRSSTTTMISSANDSVPRQAPIDPPHLWQRWLWRLAWHQPYLTRSHVSVGMTILYNPRIRSPILSIVWFRDTKRKSVFTVLKGFFRMVQHRFHGPCEGV